GDIAPLRRKVSAVDANDRNPLLGGAVDEIDGVGRAQEQALRACREAARGEFFVKELGFHGRVL
ncbi:MAG TPA: hypothetical protein VHM67_07540, partial [Gemmatimonadaceae bacterium]|nr:hypothetical protein [Gemmatimonadaceae bacterium]